jgi:magnesium-protoporphyrin IX monomethyl ester (oxidative) cyclase
MYKIALVNMPLGHLSMPSLALTQLHSVVAKTFGDRVSATVHYLNHDFAHFLGLPAYRELVSFDHHPTGLGEWFFRPVAFPEAPDNSDEYFQRYYPQHTARNRLVRELVREKRAGLAEHFDALIDRYELDRADLVGFTSMFSQTAATLGMARRLRERRPDQVVVMGGANCEAPMGRVLVERMGALDFVFSGPSLKSFPRLVSCLLEGDRAGCHRIDGVFSRRNRVQGAGCGPEGETASPGSGAPVRAFGEEMDINEPVELDYGPFLDAYESNFPGEDQPMLFFETSRGCWWGERAHCTFCGLNGSTISYRAMRPELSIRVFASLFQYSDRCSRLDSVDNILPKSYLTDVLPFLDTPPNMKLFYEVKADLPEEGFRVLENARVLVIQPGIEALNTSTLKLMRKGTSVFQNLQFLMNAVRYNIHPAWNLLIGFPGEEIGVYEKYLEDIPLLTHLPPPGGVFPVRFDRFSPYFVEAEQYGLDLHPLDWYRLTFPLEGEALHELAYYFADRHYGAPYAMNAARMVTRLRERVSRWTALWSDERTRPCLRLRRDHGTTVVVDSRSGTEVEYPIRQESCRLLGALGTAKKVPALLKEMEGLEVEPELQGLIELGLVFHEGDRYMSLLVPPKTPITVPFTRTAEAAALG